MALYKSVYYYYTVKSRLLLPFWYRLTRVVPDKGPLNMCVCVYVGARADVVCLTYVYMLEFVLDDGSGWLSAGLWKDEAVSVPVRVIFI